MRLKPPEQADAPVPDEGAGRLRVLVVDRSSEGDGPLVEQLRAAGLAAEHLADGSPRALAAAVGRGWDVVVAPAVQAPAARAAVRDCNTDTPVVVVRAQQGETIATDVRRAAAEAAARRERRRVAEQLQQSEMRLRAAVEGGFDSFFVFDSEPGEAGELDFRLVEANTRGAAIFGKHKEEVIGRLFTELAFNEERAAYFLERFRAVFESGVPLEEEYEVQSSDVPARWLHIQIVPLLSGVAITARDISERKVSETALRESEERFLSIVQNVPGVFFTLVPSEDGLGTLRFDFVSDGIETLTGHAVEEFLGPGRITLQSLLHPEDRPLIDRTDETLLAGRSFAIDVRVAHRDGIVRWAHLKIEPTFDDAGSVTGANGVILDITERKIAADALHLRERAINALVQGVVITDAREPNHPVVYVNPGYEQLTGFRRDELIGQPASSLPAAVEEATEATIQRAIAEGRPFAGEYRCRRKDGSVFWCSLLLSPVRDEESTVTHYVSISSDESPRKQLEEQFLQAQKMEAVGRLAGGIAHEFNNVLLVIRGYSHVLMSAVGEKRDGWQEAKEIETAATRASELIHHLLAFSRGQVMQAKVIDLNVSLADMRKLVEPLIGEDVELRTSFDPQLGPVKVDPAQLEQTLVSLVVNARDAMPRGGRLTIGTRKVRVEAKDATAVQLPVGGYAEIAVEDTGVGMDAETHARVFEPFFSTKGEGKRTGLGLSTAYGFVKQSGGDIAITSAPGEGTRVTIRLPQAAEAVDAPAQQAVQRHGRHAEGTVLLVEDDDSARRLVARILGDSGYRVHAAGLPGEALRFCDKHAGPIDLLLSDVVMPQMSGPTMATQILERRPETRVLFVSGYIESADDVDIVSSGADFLQKPFTPSQLLETVRRILDEPRQAIA